MATLPSDGSAGPGDVSAHPICISDVSSHSGDLDQVLYGDDLPLGVHVDLVSPASPTVSARVQQSLSHYSPPAAPLTLSAESSAPISPDCTPGTLDAGPVFEVSPDTMGFLLRAGDTAVPASPAPSGMASDRPPQLGEPVAFNLSRAVPGSDAPVISFPVYPLPSGMVLMPVSCSSQTISAPGVSSQQGRWSSAMPHTCDVSREGPFDAYCAPMDTGDCSLVSMGCPYRITSYTGPAVADTDPAFGIQMHHPRFLEFIKAHESARLVFRSPAFWVQNMDTEDAVAAAINLQRDAGLMSLNLQILCQFVTSLQQMSSEVLSLALGQVVFPSSEVAALSSAPRAPLAVVSKLFMSAHVREQFGYHPRGAC